MEESVRLQSAALMDEIDGGEERREEEGLGGEWMYVVPVAGPYVGYRVGRGASAGRGARADTSTLS